MEDIAATQNSTRHFVIDTDCGVDDSMAVMIALAVSKHGLSGDTDVMKIDAITAVGGNIGVDKVLVNCAKICQVIDIKVPIYRGSETPLIKDPIDATKYHGEDGMGGHPDVLAMEGYTDCIVEDVHAASYLVKRAKEGNFNLICIGPLTNIALALCLDSKFHERIDNIYIMGGTIHGKGNVTHNSEYNFFYDPEAA